MTRYTDEQLRELAPAYALGATTREESAAVEAAMRTSPALAAEVASFRDVTASMAQQHSMTPSPAVRDALLGRIAASKAPTVVRRAVKPMPRWMPAALAASLVLALGLGATSIAQWSQIRNARDEVRRRNDALAAATHEADRRHEQLNTILEGDQDLHLVHLKMLGGQTGTGIQFFWNAKQQRGLLHAFRLRPAPTGRAYQVWLIADGKPVGVKVFNSDPDGHALVTGITLPATTQGVTDILVTEEPASGSPLPTTTPLIGGKVRAD
jgi:anti-sigma-K factor RskA